YPIATGGQTRLSVDGQQLELLGSRGADGGVLPIQVAATTLCYRVRTSDGADAVLRLPKGASYSVDAAGQLAPNVFQQSRRTDLLTRRGDQQVIAQAYGLDAPKCSEVRCGGKPVGRLEPLRAAMVAADALRDNRAALGEAGARTLVDLYVRGL